VETGKASGWGARYLHWRKLSSNPCSHPQSSHPRAKQGYELQVCKSANLQVRQD